MPSKFRAEYHPLYKEWRAIWLHILAPSAERTHIGVAADKLILNQKIADHPGGAPIFIAIDSAFDSVRSSCVALILAYGEMPRLIYKAGKEVTDVDHLETWGINSAIERVRRRYPNSEIIVFTDSKYAVGVCNERGDSAITCYNIWRGTRLVKFLDNAAKALVNSLPATPQEYSKIRLFQRLRRQEREWKNPISPQIC